MAMVLGTSAIADDIETKSEVPTYSKEIPVAEPIDTNPEKALAMPMVDDGLVTTL